MTSHDGEVSNGIYEVRFCHRGISLDQPKEWGTVRTASRKRANLVSQARRFGGKFNPDDYLLTHCTIVASVDTEEAPNVKLGSVTENGKKINRKYSTT